MKIAVTYDNGNVFQHFGRTAQFKIYEIENGHIVSDTVVDTNGSGHEAIAAFVEAQNADVVICGGLGEEALAALFEAGIQVVSGAEGDTDVAVLDFLNDELVSDGVNCHHEEGEGCGCGGDCGSGCGGGCGGCGGCGGHMELLPGKNSGKTCVVHYRGTFNDGTQFDASYDRNEPLEFICGAGMMIPGFDAAVMEMDPGQEVDVHLMPEEAYGMPDPQMIMTFEIKDLPGSEDIEAGQQVYLRDQMGRPIRVTVTAKDDTTITLDANHEMAGKELNFHIQLVEVR
ncbi:MAG: FKBP-type peptidyl-prolyl cis-trans isomerase [Firmicutes bacterium]|nr:FKBP-type peptidyl-prolyl cis-trans isomerase [Bacillota bacterium]